MTGYPGRAALASGRATLSVSAATNELCWQISELKNVGTPTQVRLFINFAGSKGAGGNRLAVPYKAAGCLAKTELFLRELQRKPDTIYLSVHSVKYPEGAVRGAL